MEKNKLIKVYLNNGVVLCSLLKPDYDPVPFLSSIPGGPSYQIDVDEMIRFWGTNGYSNTLPNGKTEYFPPHRIKRITVEDASDSMIMPPFPQALRLGTITILQAESYSSAYYIQQKKSNLDLDAFSNLDHVFGIVDWLKHQVFNMSLGAEFNNTYKITIRYEGDPNE